LLAARETAAVILQYMASSRKKISEMVQELPRTTMIKRKIKLNGRKINLKRIAKTFKDGKIDSRDGIKIIFKDSWLQVRLSNTEPVVRLITEAYDPKKARFLVDEVEKLII